jgi:mono/diheme cytochrome c family protein
MRRVLLIGTMLVLLLALATGVALAAGDAVKGKALWEAKNCKSCHGALGEGKYAGVRAGDTRTEADWVKQVRTPRANMPAFAVAQVSDQDLADMLAYMKTLTAPASFTAVTYTAAATDMPGKVLFNQKRCVACHGDGVGLVKTRFTDKGLTVTPAAVIKQLRTPAANMPMFAATQVTDADATAVADWLKTLVAPATTAAAPAALPKTGEQLPLAQFVVAGFALVVFGVGVRLFGRRAA